MGRQAAGVQCQLAREREASEAAQKQTEELRRLQTERSQQEAELAELHAQLAAAKTAADCAERGAG
jgi:cell division protein FtsB